MRKYSNNEETQHAPYARFLNVKHNTRNKAITRNSSQNKSDNHEKDKAENIQMPRDRPPRIDRKNKLLLPAININKIENIDSNLPKLPTLFLPAAESQLPKSAGITPKESTRRNDSAHCKQRLNHFLRKAENVSYSSASSKPHIRDDLKKQKQILQPQTLPAVGPLSRIEFNIRSHMEKAPMLIVHLEGVLYSKIYKNSNYLMLNSRKNGVHQYLRSHFAVGLKTLSKHFIMVLYCKAFNRKKLMNVLEFIKAHNFQFDAVYGKSDSDCYNDYSQIYKDMAYSESQISTRVLCLEATDNSADINTMVYSTQCASDNSQVSTYSTVHTLYAPHMMFSESIYRSLSFTALASIILLLAVINQSSITKILNHTGNTIKIMCESIIKLEYLQKSGKPESTISFDKYRIELDDFHFMRKMESDEYDVFMSIDSINWIESFDILSQSKSNLYQIVQKPQTRIVNKIIKEGHVYERYTTALRERSTVEPPSPSRDTVALLSKINIPIAARNKALAFIASNIELYNEYNAHMYSNSAQYEFENKDDMANKDNYYKLWDSIKAFTETTTFYPSLLLNSWKIHKDSVEIPERYESLSKENKF